MTDTQSSSSPDRRLILIALVAALAGALLTLSLTYADHDPTPHDVPIAVVAPARDVAKVAAGLNKAQPGGFTVFRAASASAAKTALHTQRARGALVFGSGKRAQVLTAGAAGLTLAQAVQPALEAAAKAANFRPSDRDVVPLPTNDRAGLVTFLLQIGLLISSLIAATGIYFIGRRSRVWWRAGAVVLFAVVVAGLGALTTDTLFGSLTGAWLPLFGVATLGALAFALSIAAAQALLGLAATALMALVLIYLGNALSGGTVPTEMLPDVYRQISPWLPSDAIVHGVRSVVHFGGHGLGQPLLTLALWAGVALCLLVITDVLHVRQVRRTPERVAEVYATPGLICAIGLRRQRTPTGPEVPDSSRT